MLNFGQKVEEKSGDIIPKDSLLWAVINVREVKNSQSTNGRYLDIELTIADGQPYARRKIWVMVADPFDSNNSEEWRSMGYGAVRRILEAVKGATPDNANSYTLNQLTDLHGLMVPVLVTIEKGKDGYDDKNKAEFLSPHSSVKKIVECFNLLKQGVYEYAKSTKAPTAPGQGSMFTGTGSPPPVAGPHVPAAAPTAAAAPGAPAPGWLAPTGGQPTPAAAPAAPAAPTAAPQAAPGFSSGAPANPQATGFAPAAPAPLAAPAVNTAPSATTAPQSPSNWNPPAAGTPAPFPGGQ